MNVNDEEFVPKFYVMNPTTDDILKDASELRDGMEVLIADSKSRVDIFKLEKASEDTQERALKVNRWATVSKIDIDTDKGVVEFVATYSDGTKFKRWMGVKHAWLVKKDSIPDDGEILKSIRSYVDTAYLIGTKGLDKESTDASLEEISKMIIDVFQDPRNDTVGEYSEADVKTTEGYYNAFKESNEEFAKEAVENWNNPDYVIEL